MHVKVIEDSPSFLLGLTQVIEDIIGSIAKDRGIEERRCKIQNDPIPFTMGSTKKRKGGETSAINVDPEEKDNPDFDKSRDKDMEEIKVFFIFWVIYDFSEHV